MRLSQEYSGRAAYYADYEDGDHNLLVAVECRVDGVPVPVFALLDTGSQWCVLPGRLMAHLDEGSRFANTVYSTRLGRISGELHRIGVELLAQDGVTTRVDGIWFVSDEWTGPVVIGWKGCLERIRWAIDPFEERWYCSDAVNVDA